MSAKTDSMTKAEKKAYEYKKKKILLISGLGLAGLQLVASIVLMVVLALIKVVPTDYVVMIDIVLVLLCIIVAISQRWVVPGIITKVISIILTAVLIFGCFYLNKTYGAFKKVTGVDYKTTTVNVYVLSDNPAESIEDLANETFGIISELDRDNTDKAISKIEDKLGITLAPAEYADAEALAGALYNGEVSAIIMNASYVGIIENNETYADFSSKTKKISVYENKEVITKEDNETEDDNDEVLTWYVSGVDVDGAPTENRNSDVNIIITINTKTHQILLLNTPRDYYVVTSVSNGAFDKLTHAGCYGVDCSVATLESLYGINIDNYIKLNFTGFVSIIDALGGIDVYSEYDFTSYHGGDHFVVGYNTMNGTQALGFARERYSFPTGDNQRGKNQMAVINALIKKLCSSEMLKNYTDILDSISSCMVTDLTMDQIADIVNLQLKENISWDIQQYAVTGTGDNLPCFSLSAPNYVMIPNEDTVNQAKEYLNAIENNEIISVQ